MKRSKEFEFEFPAAVNYVSGGVPNDVVFCGKVITRRPEEVETRALLRSETSNGYVAWLWLPSGRAEGAPSAADADVECCSEGRRRRELLETGLAVEASGNAQECVVWMPCSHCLGLLFFAFL
ncbi:hypothetical protein JHK87_021448 [Glycine soja]|nr:hypothetical protein JHK87_021448 [Glycine soja]